MISLIFGRILQAGLVTWGVGTLTFILTRILPGDMAFRIAAGRYGDEYVNALVAESIREELGLNRPALALYGEWLYDLIHWDLGVSLVNGERVSEALLHEFGHSFKLALFALGLSLLLGPSLGIWAALSKRKWLDRITMIGATIVRAMPVYMIGILLIIIFAVHLDWFPIAGYGQLSHYLLPSLTLGLGLAVVSAMVTRNATLAEFFPPWTQKSLNSCHCLSWGPIHLFN